MCRVEGGGSRWQSMTKTVLIASFLPLVGELDRWLKREGVDPPPQLRVLHLDVNQLLMAARIGVSMEF